MNKFSIIFLTVVVFCAIYVSGVPRPDSCEDEGTNKGGKGYNGINKRFPGKYNKYNNKGGNGKNGRYYNTKGAKCIGKGWTLFERKPTAKNGFTKYWCMKAVINPEKPIPGKDAKGICTKIGAILTAPENEVELKKMTDLARAQMVRNGTQFSGSYSIDGKRVKQCLNPCEIAHATCMDKTTAFQFESKKTDPTYLFNNAWYVNQPDGMTTTIDRKFHIEDCLTVYQDTTSDKNYKINDMFCEFAVSPVSQGEIYSSFGALCGKPAVLFK